ncbi:MAG: hypothetical protein HRT83_00030 [Hyphomicrobiaceae bacterium]|nr:hypothetical protein [Hyphomicrobiaceae bacterium]
MCHGKACQKSGLPYDRIWKIEKAVHCAPPRHDRDRNGCNAHHPASGFLQDNYGRPLRLQIALQNPTMFMEIRAKGNRRAALSYEYFLDILRAFVCGWIEAEKYSIKI